jgi:hypothetical protein
MTKNIIQVAGYDETTSDSTKQPKDSCKVVGHVIFLGCQQWLPIGWS